MVVVAVVVKVVVAVRGGWQERNVEAEGIIPCQMIKVWGETVSRSTRILTRVLQTTLKQGKGGRGVLKGGRTMRILGRRNGRVRKADCDSGPSSARAMPVTIPL